MKLFFIVGGLFFFILSCQPELRSYKQKILSQGDSITSVSFSVLSQEVKKAIHKGGVSYAIFM
jgi:hypothetical protein